MRTVLITTLSVLALAGGAASAQTGAGGTNPAPPAAQGPAHSQGSAATSQSKGLPGNTSVDQLMNRTVVGADGERIGKVTDVILGPDGQAQLLVVQSGGFLGMGGKDVAIDLALAQIQPGDETIRLQEITQASVRDMPEFHYDDSMTSLNRSPRGTPNQSRQP